jgi:hypothetical protein
MSTAILIVNILTLVAVLCVLRMLADLQTFFSVTYSHVIKIQRALHVRDNPDLNEDAP